MKAGYLMPAAGGERDALDYNPEHSRRARGFAVYAALRTLGRQGVAELVERCCELANRFAEQLAAADDVEVLNHVVLNQVLVRFLATDGDHDAQTRRVIERVQHDGGVGKTTLVQHSLANSGLQVREGFAVQGGTSPFGPIVEALRSYLRAGGRAHDRRSAGCTPGHAAPRARPTSPCR